MSTTPPPPPPDPVATLYGRLSRSQRVAQLFMVGSPATGVGSTTLALVRAGRVGSVILTGRSYRGADATAAVSAAFQAASPGRPDPGLFIATDQEGGQVQVLNGTGFDQMPSGLQQGQLSASVLRADATRWGRQLASAGVNLDLGPVLDTVPSAAFAPHNPPIGAYDREFGFDPDTVSIHGAAVIAGLAAGGVFATVKHFPGLGRVTANTDTSSGVVDDRTTTTDPYLDPFRDAVADGVPFVMMSTAVYSRIDPNAPAAFSPTVVTDLLRHAVGFHGVVISDDLGNAAQIQDYSLGRRAVDFLAAGGDMVLTVDAGQLPDMRAAVLARMKTHPRFARLVARAVHHVLAAKIDRGLAR